MRALYILVFIVSAIGALYAIGSGPVAPPLPAESFAERTARICRVEAGPSARDQKDCIDRRTMAKAAETFGAKFRDGVR